MLLSPSATGLRELLRTCEHAIIYNSKNSNVLLVCKNRATMQVPSPSFAVNDTAIGEVAISQVYWPHVIAI